jgi:hypothetical protein
MKLLDDVYDSLKIVHNPVERDLYISQVCASLKIREQAVHQLFQAKEENENEGSNT